ncbi:MAG: hypothetical protein QOG10_5782 [Kribbellaceae bacterium]|nr:hypothetical protein [Kribbellaceae bacterium]
MPLVDLDDPEELRARWSALAAVAHATGFDRRWYADEQGWYHQDETGSDLRMVLLDGERSVLFGFHTQHSRTTGSDLLVGAPGWIGQPEVRQRFAAGRLGFVYGSFGGTWARAAYAGDPWQPLDDGFLPIATWLTSDEEAAEELIEWAAEWADYLGGLDELRPVGIALIRTAATTGISSDSLLDLFGRLGVGPHSPRQPDLRAALIAAEQFGGPNAGQADQAALADVDDELDDEPMETFVVPPGVSPFTGQMIKEEPAPYIPPARSEEYGIVGLNRPVYEAPVYEQDYDVPGLARLGLIGPDPVGDDDETGEIELVVEHEQPQGLSRVGGEVEDGADYYASLFADAPAAARYVHDVGPKSEPVAATQQPADDQQANAEQSRQFDDESTREFFPFDEDTAAQPSVTKDADPGRRDWVGGAWINGEWVENAAADLPASTTNAEPAGADLHPAAPSDQVGPARAAPADALWGPSALASGLSGRNRADALSGPGDDDWSDPEPEALSGAGSPEIAEPPSDDEPRSDDERFVVDDAAQTIGVDPEEPDSFASPAGGLPDDAPTAEIAAVLDVEVGEPGEVQQAEPAAAHSVEADSEEDYYPTSRSPFAPTNDPQRQPGEYGAEVGSDLSDVELEGGPQESFRAPELVVPPPSTPPIAIPGLGLVASQAPRLEPAPGSLEEAMRAEQERPRPRPGETPALEALRDWCRARTGIVPSGFTIQVQVLDPAAPSYRFDLEPPEVHDPPEHATDRLADLLGDLWLAEAGSEQDGWLFARIDAAGRTLRIDRWYDQVPDWWDNPVEPQLDAQGLARRLHGRGVDQQPDYLRKLYTDAR